jgi:trk system potassium uptake protein TrkH
VKQAATTIILTFLTAILIGAVLLSLPAASRDLPLPFTDALFTATSAVTVTGLTVVDTAGQFTLFGKVVILVLFQFGGLGFMTFSTLVILLLGKSISLSGKFILENDFTPGQYKNIRDLVRRIFLLTLGFEGLGTLVLFLQYQGAAPGERLFSALFHSVSAFCNAGFSVFSNSLEDYTAHAGINLTMMALISCGGIGFLVLNEIYQYLRRRIPSMKKFSLHSKLVLTMSVVLVLGGSTVIFLEELVNPSDTLTMGEKIFAALFQSVTARTAGFNTVNLTLFSTASIWILLLLMFIGSSPGSTGGGIKTSTAGIVVAYLRSRLRGREGVDLFYRNVPTRTMEKAFLVINLSFLLISFAFLLLLTFDPHLSISELLFEAVSAFGTVGLSLGVTSGLSLGSKLTLMVTMFIGRIGPLTLLIALSKKESGAVYDYPDGNIMIG